MIETDRIRRDRLLRFPTLLAMDTAGLYSLLGYIAFGTAGLFGKAYAIEASHKEANLLQVIPYTLIAIWLAVIIIPMTMARIVSKLATKEGTDVKTERRFWEFSMRVFANGSVLILGLLIIGGLCNWQYPYDKPLLMIMSVAGACYAILYLVFGNRDLIKELPSFPENGAEEAGN